MGTEEHKGRSELREAFDLIGEVADQAEFDFVGFVEGGDIPGNVADVIVTDGFTGNVAIKTGEGTANLIGDLLKEAFRYSPLSRLASVLAVTSLRRLRKRIDPRRVNGGVFLGLNAPLSNRMVQPTVRGCRQRSSLQRNWPSRTSTTSWRHVWPRHRCRNKGWNRYDSCGGERCGALFA